MEARNDTKSVIASEAKQSKICVTVFIKRYTKLERESDHAIKVAAIASYQSQIGGNLDIRLQPLKRNVAQFFHDFYTKSDPVCWWEFCDNFEELGGIITRKSGSVHIFEWCDPTVPGVILKKEIHEPHPHHLFGDYYRLHIARFLNVLRAFRHERMHTYLNITKGKVFDRRTFEEDLIRFWQ